MISKNQKSKYTLAIDTTSKIAGVALAKDNEIVAESNIDNGLTHSVTIFCNIDKVLNKSHVDMSMINKICVANGPGSFTGIRIGIAAALGLSKPYSTDIVYIDSLKSLAYNVKNDADYIIGMIDAKVDRVYISIYRKNTLSQVLKDMIIDVETLCKYLNKYFTNKNVSFVFVGDGAITYKEYFNKNLKIHYKLAKINNIYQKASSLIFVNGEKSKFPKINYMLASKAERERNNA